MSDRLAEEIAALPSLDIVQLIIKMGIGVEETSANEPSEPDSPSHARLQVAGKNKNKEWSALADDFRTFLLIGSSESIQSACL